jgi:hypothetical protein
VTTEEAGSGTRIPVTDCQVRLQACLRRGPSSGSSSSAVGLSVGRNTQAQRNLLKYLLAMVPVEGLEPPTHGLQNLCQSLTERATTGHIDSLSHEEILALARIVL